MSASIMSWCFSSPCLVSALHITPLDMICFTLEMSYGLPRSAAASRAASMGFANASPTMTMSVTRRRSTTDHNRPGSSPSSGIRTIAPPMDMCTKQASHMPVPCISGQAQSTTETSSPTASRSPGRSLGDSRGSSPRMATAMFRRPAQNSPLGYITPLGMPVVPPV